MPIHNRNPTEEDREAYRALEKLRENEGNTTPQRAMAIVMEEPLKEAFKSRYGVEKKSSGQCCARRLLGKQCLQYGPGPVCEPHRMPHQDHTDLWLDQEGEPAVITSHLYDLPYGYVKNIVEWCDEWGFTANFDSGLSWYFPARTTLVAITVDETRE